MESHRNLNHVRGLLIPKSYISRIKEEFLAFKKKDKCFAKDEKLSLIAKNH